MRRIPIHLEIRILISPVCLYNNSFFLQNLVINKPQNYFTLKLYVLIRLYLFWMVWRDFDINNAVSKTYSLLDTVEYPTKKIAHALINRLKYQWDIERWPTKDYLRLRGLLAKNSFICINIITMYLLPKCYIL